MAGTVIFEGPGQWGALKLNSGLVFRPDYEKPVQSVVNYLLSRSDVDEDKIAIIGYSMGGYLAPRAAQVTKGSKHALPIH